MLFTAIGASQAHAQALPSCGMPEMAHMTPPPLAKPTHNHQFLTKVTRPSFGTPPHIQESDNFALLWGDDLGEISPAIRKEILDTAEAANDHFTNLGLPELTGFGQYRINIYIGSTDQSTVPEIGQGAAGFAWIDDDGYPFMTINTSTFNGSGYLPHTVTHELMHLVQFSAKVYGWQTSNAAWFWEATAETATASAMPMDPFYYTFVGQYAVTPEITLPTHGGGGNPNSPSAARHYGAGLFFQYIDEHLGHENWFVDAWSAQQASSYPLRDLKAYLESQGQNINDAFADFAAHNAFMDYKRKTVLNLRVDASIQGYPKELVRHRSGYIGVKSGQTLTQKSGDYIPETMGYNTMNVGIDGLDHDYRVTWPNRGASRAVLAVKRTFEFTYHDFKDVPEKPNEQTFSFKFQGDELEAAIIIVGLDKDYDPENFPKQYPYSVSVEEPTIEKEIDEDPEFVVGGGGCASTGFAPMGVAALALILSIVLMPRARRQTVKHRKRSCN